MQTTDNAWLGRTSLTTQCGKGFGLAACPALGLLVTSDRMQNTLSVWRLPSGNNGGAGAAATRGLALACTLGREKSPHPMQFNFFCWNGVSGYLAFVALFTTADASDRGAPMLLITDHGSEAVHIVDVVGQRHVGYVAAPGSLGRTRGVAACNTATLDLVAVSAWDAWGSSDHVVYVFVSSGGGWSKVRVIGGGFGRPGPADGQMDQPMGLRFTADGTAVCVSDRGNNRVSMFRVADGGFVRHVATDVNVPYDVEEVEDKWVVACSTTHTVEIVGGVDPGGCARSTLGRYGNRDGEFGSPVALAVVPGLGLVVREYNGGRLQVFSTPDMVAM